AIDRAGNMSEDEILEYLCKMGFVDRSIVKEKEFFDYYISLMKIDMSLLESFDYEGQKGVMINCPIISFNGEDDDRALLKQSLEWKDFTNMGFERELFKGGHFYLRDDPERVVKHLETYF
ncbi:MAG: hypothetical protein K2I33_02875, partial [Oscillospiraceae bacterium]|nr:hypothetical protein [Oscillospiraceae bacterium]